MNLLHIDSSILAGNSVTRLLSADIVTAEILLHPGLTVTYRDLAAAPLPHFAGADDDQGVAVLQELLAADIVVIGAPMYNFGIPSQLKSWIDRIVIAGKTFRYGENGPEGLVTGKKLLVASARGGAYASTPIAFLDHQESYLTAVFHFIGITDVTYLRAENVSRPDLRDASIAAARAEIGALVA